MKTMNIIFGDYWDDGHGKYTKLSMRCNKTPTELMEAEKESEVLTGYQFQTNGKYPTICNDYEDRNIPDNVIEDLIIKGFNNVETHGTDTWPLHELENGIDDFAEFFMRWLKMSTPDLEWEWTTNETPEVIFNCRGYGLYH